MNAFLQASIDGILMGGVYALAALGISLIFGVMKITNFAHGALITVGMYVAYEVCTLLNITPYIALPIVMVVMFIIGYFIQKICLNPLMGVAGHNQLLLTQGLAIILENLILVIFSAGYKSVSVPGFDTAIKLGDITINKPKLVAFIFVTVITIGIYVILNKTDLGKAIRATSVQPEGATLMGIVVPRINQIAFGLGIVCAGVAGALLTPTQYIFPTSGNTYSLKCFVIAVFGGLGNIWGAIVAGLIIGAVESFSALYLGGSWSELVVYLIFILTLIIKPTGLLGKKAR
ncbi:MAG: branched-chain amino acid ABC transporter permease [Lachnospiraceae bacterium]|nr:branched-chain amino acid ABC transporter permease [Candidatus Merdinaster equi]